MFKDETDFEKVVDRLNVDITPNPEHREKLRRQMLSVFSTTVQQSQKRIAPIGAFRRKFMRSRMTKLAAAVVIIIAVLVGINPFSRSNGSFAAMIENTEQMPWIHIVSSKYRGSDEHRTEAWMSLRSKIIAKKWDDTLTFVSGIEQREYLYDSSQNKIFVSSGDYSRPAFYSPIELMRTYIHRIETMAVSFKTEDKLIDGIQMEIISVQVWK